MKYEILKDKIKEIISECKSKADIVKKLEIKSGGAIYKKIDKIIEEEKLDISHFIIKPEKGESKYKKIKKECLECRNEFETKEEHPKETKCCSRKCSNKYFKRNHTEETKEKISKSLTKNVKIEKESKRKKGILKKCRNCGNEYYVSFSMIEKSKYCSLSCSTTYRNKYENLSRNAGLKSSISQNKRSKNEIYFADLCIKYFKDVKTNEPIFNGWDADIIIEDLKLAVMWNGKWHYEKITKKHSLKQVQNRDKIKIKEIINCGYEPYIIKDMGKYNPKFVEYKFEKLLEKIKIDNNSF